MVEFDIPKQQSSIIKVIGVGGGGSNAVNFMHSENIEGVDFIICNTDAKALEQSAIANKIQLGPHLTQGLGAGANPEVGKQATEESLEEIQRILEVNTKMAFICAGMGGGTGTGGAPIIAKICKDLGILTVGIVTTPFSFEGPRRAKQAEEGIRQLEPYVDTLLVISNDKMRLQYGNLKMKEAFGKADNVLATAAKCITDIINSRGHIIVDFNDVVTVMKNGGVAILGSSSVDGEDRAQRAIEDALNSPLLNDSDIKGAKWILINVNTSEGDYECSMDEFEQINSYVREQAGENTDVIAGIGYDNSLEKKIAITLIATGFDHKDPFYREDPAIAAQREAEKNKVVLELKENETVAGAVQQETITSTIAETPQAQEDPYAPHLSVPETPATVNVPSVQSAPVNFELKPDVPDAATNPYVNLQPKAETPTPQPQSTFVMPQQDNQAAGNNIGNNSVYASRPQQANPFSPFQKEEEPTFEVSHNANVQPVASHNNIGINDLEETEAERQKRLAQERIKKLRELSFNVNNSDPNSEFDAVPAYVRRKMDMFGSNDLSAVENFYSKYQVKKDENDNTSISTLNTFLDGKKPD